MLEADPRARPGKCRASGCFDVSGVALGVLSFGIEYLQSGIDAIVGLLHQIYSVVGIHDQSRLHQDLGETHFPLDLSYSVFKAIERPNFAAG